LKMTELLVLSLRSGCIADPDTFKKMLRLLGENK
jgi:hypothetical protein